MSTMSKLMTYQGPAILSYGFRPFFLFGAIYSGAAVIGWLVMYWGEMSVPTAFAPRDWHVHEMLFGYVAAVVAGFLMTAVPNWTGRLPIQGRPLAILLSVWVAGRIAIYVSAWIGWILAASIDVAFLLLLAAAVAREIVAGRKWSNLKVVGIACLLALTNIAFHVEAHFAGVADYATRAGIALVITLIALIGGRIVPSFTRNWLARQNPGRMPVPFAQFDGVAMVIGTLALAIWVVTPTGPATAGALSVAAILHLIRLVRWAGYRTVPDRLVLILHVAYAFVPAGYVLSALAAVDLAVPSAGIHAWTGGAIGSMTIAVMTRASLGHTGRALSATVATQLIYAAVTVAALARICAALEADLSHALLPLSATAWALAFLGFAAVYGPMLCTQRRV